MVNEINDNKLKSLSANISSIMNILGIEETESNKDTPFRVAKMLLNERFKNLNEPITTLDQQMKLFKNTGDSTPVKVTIPFNSTCEHHWMPFFGEAVITYTPSDSILGLSKFPRVVEFFSLKPQLQETLTKEIGEYLYNLLQPQSLTVEIKAEHTCVSMRGIRTPCVTETIWSK